MNLHQGTTGYKCLTRETLTYRTRMQEIRVGGWGRRHLDFLKILICEMYKKVNRMYINYIKKSRSIEFSSSNVNICWCSKMMGVTELRKHSARLNRTRWHRAILHRSAFNTSWSALIRIAQHIDFKNGPRGTILKHQEMQAWPAWGHVDLLKADLA